MLLDLAVQPRRDLKVGRVGIGLYPWPERTESVEALGPGPLAVSGLEVTRGYVVGAGIAEDHIGDAVSRNLLRQAADHHGKLAFVVDAIAEPRGPQNGITRSGHGRRRLQEDDRLLWRLASHLSGVVGVILADADHLARQDRGEKTNIADREADSRQLDVFGPAAEGMSRELGDHKPIHRPGTIRLGGPVRTAGGL